MMSLYSKSAFLLFFVLSGCTKLPETESSSVVSYYIDGKFVQSFYISNSLVIETTQNWKNRIILDARSEVGRFGFVIVSDSIVGSYTYENNFNDESENRITLHLTNGNPFGFSSSNCASPSFIVVINSWYKGQRTISGTFQGTVCDDEGNKLEITYGTFEYVKQVDF